MTLANFSFIAEIVSAIAVVVTLVYLALQISHANKLARMQTRGHMMEMAREELGTIIDEPEMVARLIKPAPLEFHEAIKLYHFLILAIRHREWEWYQATNGAISKADAEQVKRDCLEVVGIWLCYPRTRNWWVTVGRFGLNPEFAAEIDAFLAKRPDFNFVDNLMALETTLVERQKQEAELRQAAPVNEG